MGPVQVLSDVQIPSGLKETKTAHKLAITRIFVIVNVSVTTTQNYSQWPKIDAYIMIYKKLKTKNLFLFHIN